MDAESCLDLSLAVMSNRGNVSYNLSNKDMLYGLAFAEELNGWNYTWTPGTISTYRNMFSDSIDGKLSPFDNYYGCFVNYHLSPHCQINDIADICRSWIKRKQYANDVKANYIYQIILNVAENGLHIRNSYSKTKSCLGVIVEDKVIVIYHISNGLGFCETFNTNTGKSSSLKELFDGTWKGKFGRAQGLGLPEIARHAMALDGRITCCSSGVKLKINRDKPKSHIKRFVQKLNNTYEIAFAENVHNAVPGNYLLVVLPR